MSLSERPVCRGGEEQEPGHGQPLAGDPGAAEVTAAAPGSAGARGDGGGGGSVRVRGRLCFPPALPVSSEASVEVFVPVLLAQAGALGLAAPSCGHPPQWWGQTW